MTGLLYALASLGAFALAAGLILAIAQKAFHIEGDPMVTKSMPCCHKPSAANAVIQAANPMPQPWLPVKKK